MSRGTTDAPIVLNRTGYTNLFDTAMDGPARRINLLNVATWMAVVEWTCSAGSVNPQTITSYITIPAGRDASIAAPHGQTIGSVRAKLLEATGTPTDGTSGMCFGISEVV